MLQPEIDAIIRMAWHDSTSFDAIEAKTGLTETAVIKLMRQHLKQASFRRWRKRVSGRPAKHRKRLKRSRQDASTKPSRYWLKASD